jgi:hypothetical protein
MRLGCRCASQSRVQRRSAQRISLHSLTASANDGSMQCPVCSSAIVITIAAAALDELDRRVCRSCRWSAYVDGTAHGRGYGRRAHRRRVSVGRAPETAFGPS